MYNEFLYDKLLSVELRILHLSNVINHTIVVRIELLKLCRLNSHAVLLYAFLWKTELFILYFTIHHHLDVTTCSLKSKEEFDYSRK